MTGEKTNSTANLVRRRRQFQKWIKKLDKAGLLLVALKLSILEENDSHLSKY